MENATVTLIGAGATGSHAAPVLARMPEVRRVLIVDPGTYESGNLAVQAIDSQDVGHPKAVTLAAKLRRIRPDLTVVAVQGRVEDQPRGILRGGLLVSCVDSRMARQHINEIAFRLGSAWVDCGVLASQSLARVSAYLPARAEEPCLECGWSAAEYAALEAAFTCGGAPREFPTQASPALSALAASLLATEAAKLLRGEAEPLLAAHQLVMDAASYRTRVTARQRNPWCRFDHRRWEIEPWSCPPESTTLGDALHALGSLRVEGHRWVGEQVCPECGQRSHALRLNRPQADCAGCGRRMIAARFGAVDRLDARLAVELAATALDTTLAQAGLRAGDIVTGGSPYHRLQYRQLEAA